MATSENLISIPGRLHSVATEGHVAGADEIYDDDMQMLQSAINADLKNGTLYPVNVNTLTPSSTFVKNAIIGINGVLYRATKNTSNLPCTFVIESGAFVTHTVNGKIAFVISNAAPNTDWEIFTDASIEYWIENINAALQTKALASDLTTHTSNSDIHVTAANKSTWNGKQDAISDLSTIRSNASAGASAVQPTDTYSDGSTTYTVDQLLQAVADFMSNTVVVQN